VRRPSLLLAVLAVSHTALADPAEPPVKLAGGPSYAIQLQPKQERAEVRIPVQLAPEVKSGSFASSVADVSLDRVSQSALAASMTARLEAQALILSAAAKQLRAPGTYHVRVQLEPKDEVGKRSYLELDLEHASAVVRAQPLILERFRGWGGEYDQKSQLALQETSQKAAVTWGTVVPATAFTGPDGLALPAKIGFPEFDLSPGSSVLLEPTLSGDFPIGVSRATFEVRAPQLRTPLEVSCEVRTRLHSVWLFVFLLFGLGLSWLLRNVFERRLARAEQQSRIDQTLRAIERADGADPILRAALAEARAPLDTLYRTVGAKAEEITTQLTVAQQALDKALEDLAKRREETEADARELMQALDFPAALPPEVRAALEAGRPGLHQALSAFTNGNITSASALLDSARAEVTRRVVSAVQSWLREVRRGVSGAVELKGSLADLRDLEALPRVRTALAELEGKTELAELLEPASAAWQSSLELATETRDAISGYALEIAESLPGSGGNAIRDVVAELTAPSEAEQRPETWLLALLTVAKRLVAAVKSALKTRMNTVPDADARKQLGQAMAAGEYRSVARQLAAATDEGKLQGDAPDVTKQLAIRPKSKDSVDSAVSGPSTLFVANQRPIVTPAERSRVDAAADKTRYLQEALTALFTAIVGYLIFVEKFVGTPGEILSVVGWTFGSNLGLAGFLELVKGQAPKAP
jgi:hypothetical protein